MKVFGFTTSPGPDWGATTRQVRVIVAAPSRRKAGAAFRALMGGSDYFYSQYMSESWNARECEKALAQPGVVMFSDEIHGAPFRPVPTKES